MAENETKLCNNCKKQISVSNFMMHEMHCRRHIALCEHCQEPIPKGEMSVHFEETHAKIKCPKCDVEVEKANLEDHEENDCMKRPMKCIYCQLEFAKDALESHLDYCGSRTEQCPKCLQYIKLKDQTKHEESSCQFPEVRPKNNNRPDYVGGLSEPNGEQYGMHPFAFDELSRVIGQRAVGEPSVPRRPVRVGENKTDNVRPRVSRPVKVQNVSRPTVSRSNLNRKTITSKEATKAPSPETDYDHLLAMHLAQDLNQEEELDAVVKALEKPSPSTPPHMFDVVRDRNTFSEDLVLIPCEFCGEPFTSNDLVQHQSSCSLDRITEMLPTLTPTLTNNSRTDVPVSPALVDPPSIINNLGPVNAEWMDDTVNLMNDGVDDMMLPCEFCAELFPIDTLIQHQAICDSNATMTPRVTTPVGTRSRRKNQGLLSRHDLADEFPNLSSRRHQPPPGLPLDSDSEDDTVARRTQPKTTVGANSHRVTKPNTRLGKNRDTSSSAISPTASVNSILRKYGVEGQDRGDYYDRRGSQHSRVTDTDSWLEPCAPIAKKRTGSASPTRDTLNGLLYETSETPSHDLLAHIGGPKTRKNESNSTRQKAVVTPATRSVAKTRSTNTNAREVQRELSRSGASLSSQQPRNSRTNKSNIEVRVRPAAADEISESVLTNQRMRAQVFGARNGKATTMRRKPEGN